jgi:hypothetical protein
VVEQVAAVARDVLFAGECAVDDVEPAVHRDADRADGVRERGVRDRGAGVPVEAAGGDCERERDDADAVGTQPERLCGTDPRVEQARYLGPELVERHRYST